MSKLTEVTTQDRQLQTRREYRLDRLKYYKQQSEAICQNVVSEHRRQGIPLSIYIEQTSRIATSVGSMLRRGIVVRHCETLGVRWPPTLQSTRLVIDYGTSFEATFAFCLREWSVKEEWKKEKRRHGPLKAVCGFMLGCLNVVASSVFGDGTSFWAYNALRHVAMPCFPALTLSLWAGSMAVRSAARYFSVRRCTATCGEACVLLAKANCAALLMYPRPKSWVMFAAQMLGALACGLWAEIATIRGLEDASHQKLLAWLLRRPVRMPDFPMLMVGERLEDDMEEVGCHDLKCPITFALLVQPVEVHGKVYERRAVLEWIRLRHTVPHSPRDPVSEHSLRPCWPMQRLLREFKREFWDELSIGAMPGRDEDQLLDRPDPSVLRWPLMMGLDT